MIFTI